MMAAAGGSPGVCCYSAQDLERLTLQSGSWGFRFPRLHPLSGNVRANEHSRGRSSARDTLSNMRLDSMHSWCAVISVVFQT